MKKLVMTTAAALCLLLCSCGGGSEPAPAPAPEPSPAVQEEASIAGNYVTQDGYGWLLLYEDGTGIWSVQDVMEIVWNDTEIADPGGLYTYAFTTDGDAITLDLGNGYTDTYTRTEEPAPDFGDWYGGSYDTDPAWFLEGNWRMESAVTEGEQWYTAPAGIESYLTVTVQDDGSLIAAFSLLSEGRQIVFDNIPMTISEEGFLYAEGSSWTAEAAGSGTAQYDGQAPLEAELLLQCAPQDFGTLVLTYTISSAEIYEGGDVCYFVPDYAAG